MIEIHINNIFWQYQNKTLSLYLTKTLTLKNLKHYDNTREIHRKHPTHQRND